MSHYSKNLIWYDAGLSNVTEREVGGKGWNLFRLRQSGFPVPPWVVVSSRVFDDAMAGQMEKIERILSHLDFNDKKSLGEASEWIARIISQTELPEHFSTELSTTLEKLFGKKAFLSIRSSVMGEDSKDNSFAGQMDSFLNVPPSQAAETIKKVWSSAFSSRALLYRHRKNIGHAEISTAVILQAMVQSVSSGVLFTADTGNQTNQSVISAGYGLGEGVVANLVETDTYRINRNTKKILKEIGLKNDRVVLNDLYGKGTHIESIPLNMQKLQVLTDRQILRLHAMGKKAERLFGTPQDMEWACDKKGRLFILQARPIVSTMNPVSQAKLRIWDNSNIVESYPELTLPLTFSFAQSAYEKVFRNATLGFVPFKREMKGRLGFCQNMIGLLDGRIYYNLLSWYEMLSYLPSFKKHKDSWDQMIGISQKIGFPDGRLSWPNRLGICFSIIYRLLSTKRTAKKFFANFDPLYPHFRDIDLSHITEDEVIALFESLDQKLTDKWHLTLYNDFCAMKYYDWLKKLCNRWGLDRFPNLHNDLLSGQKDMESVKPVNSLLHLAESVRLDPTLVILFEEKDNEAIWRKIESDTKYAQLKEKLDAHLRVFGDRGVEELKLEKPTYGENPAALIGLVKSYCHSGMSPKTIQIQEEKLRKKAEEITRQNLKNPFKKMIFNFVVKNARMAIANRENMRFSRSRLYGIVRNLFRRMGALFEEKGLLQSASDIYYLAVEEIFAFVQGKAVTRNLQDLVELRKKEYADFSHVILRERIETKGIPYLNSLGQIKSDNRNNHTLQGIGCSSGMAEGSARVVLNPDTPMEGSDNILVAKSTDPGWVFLMLSSKGIVVEKGSVLSHTAIIGRELGIPTIVGVKDATRLIQDGSRISIDGSRGEVRWK
jgi:phosphohistidine swiveling domain-containing protein